MTAHSIGGQDWYTATVRWFASGLMMLTGPWLTPAANVLETRVLLTQDENGARISILRSQPPRALTAEEASRVPHTWINWRQELAARFPPNPVLRQTSSGTSVLPQSGSTAEAVASLLALVIAGWTNRKKSK
jgi:hypothetical protein